MTWRRGAAAVAVLTLATTLVAATCLRSPLVLYPLTPSLPEQPYLRTFGSIEIGKIAAFPMPTAARRYQAGLGHDVPAGFLFMKPVVAGPGDHVCNSVSDGLVIKGQWRGATLVHDRSGHPLPFWAGCRVLGERQYFMVSVHVPNSFDSRYFGPVDGADIVGVYRPIF
jgi:type IV secretory pathway protease TraF